MRFSRAPKTATLHIPYLMRLDRISMHKQNPKNDGDMTDVSR